VVTQKEEYLKREEVAGLKCHLIRITLPDERRTRLLWIADKHYLVVKTVERGRDGKVTRTTRVVEFFETANGQLLPREHEITVPKENIRMKVRAMHGFRGLIIPEDVLDPVTFGTYPWRR
jgi:hypothetical protein